MKRAGISSADQGGASDFCTLDTVSWQEDDVQQP